MTLFKNILCVLEADEESSGILEQAALLVESNKGALTILAVLDSGRLPGKSAQQQSALLSDCAQRLNALAEPYRKKIEINTKVLKGKPYLEIIREVLRSGNDLVLKAVSPSHWQNRFFIRTDKQLLCKCPCPVWFIEQNVSQTSQTILAVVDVSDTHPPAELKLRQALNQQILKMATAMAMLARSELHIVQAWNLVGESAMRGSFIRTSEEKITAYAEQTKQQYIASLEALIEDWSSRLGKETFELLSPRVHLVKGWEQKEIPALAKQIAANLVIIGSFARTGVADLTMNNSAKAILLQLTSSFLVIKPANFITPVTVPENY